MDQTCGEDNQNMLVLKVHNWGSDNSYEHNVNDNTLNFRKKIIQLFNVNIYIYF